jgi:hypothetical protein
VEQHQARLQNIKPNEDYGTSPQDQFDNLVLRGDILRLLVHIDRIKVCSHLSLSLSLSLSILVFESLSFCCGCETHELIVIRNDLANEQ